GMSSAQKEIEIRARINDENFFETFNFAASLESGSSILLELLREVKNGNNFLLLDKALLISQSVNILDESLAQELAERTLKIITSDNRKDAHRTGEMLIFSHDGVRQCVRTKAVNLLESPYVWTRIIAWTCLITDELDEAYFNLLIKELPSLAQDGARGALRTLTGAWIIADSGRPILEELVLRAAKVIFSRVPPNEAEIIIAPLISKNLNTIGFRQKIYPLLKKYNMQNLGMTQDMGAFASHFSSQDYNKAVGTFYKKVFSFLVGNVDAKFTPNQEEMNKPLLFLSGFFNVTNYWETAASDIWEWKDDTQDELAKYVLPLVLDIWGVNKERVHHEVQVLIHAIDEKQSSVNLHSKFPTVDLPTIDWQRAKGVDYKLDRLEAGLYHRSTWLSFVTATLIAYTIDKDELKKLIARVFEKGEGNTLSAASAMVSVLDKEDALDLIIQRLLKPVTSGCSHLYVALEKLTPSSDKIPLQIIKNGILSNFPYTATRAAKFGALLANPTNQEFLTLLKQAYHHWKKTEKPYPKNGGTVPESPRAHIVSAWLKIVSPTNTELLEFAQDVRPDVRDAVKEELIQRLQVSNEFRSLFLNAVKNGSISIEMLTKALKERVIFSKDEIEEICELLTHKNPTYRFSAINVLDSFYLPSDKIDSFIKTLMNDEEIEIREAIGSRNKKSTP
ncbi:MAG: hypothetical protein ACAH83_14400, partial [Alphaproteobacteria bacterium]